MARSRDPAVFAHGDSFRATGGLEEADAVRLRRLERRSDGFFVKLSYLWRVH